MRPDRIHNEGFKRSTAASLTAKMQRGRVSHLLFVVENTTFRKKDKITVKLRHGGGSMNVVDRIAASDLAQISDMKYGVPSFGSVFPSDYSYNGQTTENDNTAANILYGRNAILLPIGNVFLQAAGAELEILLETSTGGEYLAQQCFFKLYAIDYSTSSAHIIQWDKTEDLEAQHKLVREIYLLTKENESFFPTSAADPLDDNKHNLIAPLDIQIQMDVDGTTYNSDLIGLGAVTSLIGELATPSGSMVRIFEDNDSLPSSVWLEVSGDDAKKAYVLCAKEVMFPTLTSQSQHELVAQAQVKMEKLERENPDAARAYVKAGVAVPSATLQEVKEQLPAAPVATAK